MRLVAAMMKHETNTFSPVATPLARFARGRGAPARGEEARREFQGTGSGLGAYIDLAREHGAELHIPLAAGAWPSGVVEDAAYEAMSEAILEGVATSAPDAILLDLHGAMVTESLEDGEGELLRRIREIAPATPIGVALDMHANMYPGIAEHADVVAGYQTYPHVDSYETALRAGRPILGMLAGTVSPTMAWGNRAMLPHVMRQGTDDSPNRELQARAREMEADGALAASLFVGFPHADIREAGLSAVVVSDGDRALAERWRDELLDAAWRERERFVYRIEPLGESMARARAAASGEGPVILLDHYDNAASGGTMDTTAVLAAIVEAGLEDVAAFAIHDPRAVTRMIAAGVGAEVTLPLGGKLDMPAIGRVGEPLEVTGRVRLISEGRYQNLGPASPGVWMDMGPSVVLDTGRIEIVVISRHQEPNDLACLASLGIDARAKRYLMLKSRIHYRAGFRDVAAQVIECAGVGVCTSDYGMLDFSHVRRPIFPLDRVES